MKTYSFWIASFLLVDYRGHSRQPRCYAAEGEECLNGLGETEENRKEYSYFFFIDLLHLNNTKILTQCSLIRSYKYIIQRLDHIR